MFYLSLLFFVLSHGVLGEWKNVSLSQGQASSEKYIDVIPVTKHTSEGGSYSDQRTSEKTPEQGKQNHQKQHKRQNKVDPDKRLHLFENDPEECRCGEVIIGPKSVPIDIQDWDASPVTTTRSTVDPEKKEFMEKVMKKPELIEQKVVDMMDNKRMKAFSKIDSDSSVNLTAKYAPYIPNPRPWLVIIEVNMTNSSLNTECTGETCVQWTK